MLTPYQLACGYVEQQEIKTTRVTLWNEHGVYHVRAHDFEQRGRLAWEVFTKLTEAREFYTKLCKQYLN